VALSDYQALVDDFVRDTGETVTVEQRDRAIELARLRYSADRPRVLLEEVMADGSSMLALPPSWVQDFSRLSQVKDGGRTISSHTELTLNGHVIRMDERLAAGTAAQVLFTTTHLLNGLGDNTIPETDREAVSHWAAAALLEQMASHYSGHKRPTIQADAVDWDSKGRDYANRAKRLRQLYLDHLGIDPKRNAAAGVVVDMDRGASSGGDRFIHSQRRR